MDALDAVALTENMTREELIQGCFDHLESTTVGGLELITDRSDLHRYLESQAKAIEDDEHVWAWDELYQLCDRDPVAALDVVVELIDRSPDVTFLGAIGAGPLEDLIGSNAERINDQVNVQLRRNERFRYAFVSGYYPDVSPDVIRSWTKVFAELGTTKDRVRDEYIHQAGR